MEWVLIILMDWGQSMAADHILFETEQLCEAARMTIESMSKSGGWDTFCFRVRL